MAQSVPRFITGRVLHAQNQKAISTAIITLIQQNKNIAFVYSDAQGNFKIQVPKNEVQMQLKVSKLGFEAQFFPVDQIKTSPVDVFLKEKVEQLKEVSVKAPIVRKNDTLSFDVSAFQNARDRSIGDIIAKLPGMEISADGTVSHNGKPINKFYIEGMNLLEEKYGLAVNNVSAEDVKTVEVLENHQPIKALKDVEDSERSAINLKLKDKAKAKWVGSGTFASGLPAFLAQAGTTAMMFKAQFQTLNVLKANNLGMNIANEVRSFNIESLRDGVMPSFISDGVRVPIQQAPIDEQRYFFNQSAMGSVNALKALKKDWEWRTNLSAVVEKLDFNQNTNTQFIQNQQNSISVLENTQSYQRKRQLDVGTEWSRNIKSVYLKYELKSVIHQNDDHSTVEGTLSNRQVADLPQFKIHHQLRALLNKNSKIYKFGNLQEFIYMPQQLDVHFLNQNRLNQMYQQRIFNSRSSLGFDFKLGKLQLNQLALVSFENQNFKTQGIGNELNVSPWLAHLNFKHLELNYKTEANYTFRKFTLRLELPLKFHLINAQLNTKVLDKSYFFLNYSGNLKYKIYRDLDLNFGVHSNNQVIAPETILGAYRFLDYRSVQKGVEGLNYSKSMNYSFFLTYYKPIQFFSMYAMSSYQEVQNPLLRRLQYLNSISVADFFWMQNATATSTSKINVRKSWIDFNLSSGLELNHFFSRQNFLQLDNLQNFKINSVQLLPNLSWNYKKIWSVKYEAKVQANFQKFNENAALRIFWQQQHSMNLTYILNERWNLSSDLQYFKNQIDANRHKEMLFLDAEIRYVTKNKWQFNVSLKNITNQQNFAVQSFSANQIQVNRFQLRPLNVLLGMYYKF